MTRVVVTHTLEAALLRRYDGILVLKNGRIAESGSFDELMEKKGYIRRVDVMSDARLKRIVLTDKGHEVLRGLDRCIDRMEDHLHSLLTPDEVDTLIELLHKLRDGMPEEGLSCPPPPDEICCIELQNKELEGHR